MPGPSNHAILLFMGVPLAGLLLYVAMSSKPPPRGEPTRAAPTPAPTTAPADAEAFDAAAMLRAYYPLGQHAQSTNWLWMTCMDEKKGYSVALKCCVDAEASARERAEELKSKPHALSRCGKEIEAAHRAFIDAQVKFHSDFTAWMNTHRAELTARMANASESEACSADGACVGQPIEGDQKYGAIDGAGYARINHVACTKNLFQCGPPDNVCSINKVADRLGIGESYKGDGLRVRQTGTLIQ